MSKIVYAAAYALDAVYWSDENAKSARTAMLKLLRGSCEFSCGWSPRVTRERVIARAVIRFVPPIIIGLQ